MLPNHPPLRTPVLPLFCIASMMITIVLYLIGAELFATPVQSTRVFVPYASTSVAAEFDGVDKKGTLERTKLAHQRRAARNLALATR
jgi:hypothetical protein